MLIDKGHKFEVEYFTQSNAKVFMDGIELQKVKAIHIEEQGDLGVATVKITFLPREIKVYRSDENA